MKDDFSIDCYIINTIFLFQKCGPGPLCGDSFQEVQLSDADRQYIVDIHNYLRNKVALGFEKRGEQPSATNMNIIVSYIIEN